MYVQDRKGIIALITVLVVTLFLFSLAILLSAQGNSSIISSQFGNQASRAEFLAHAGLQDALIKIARIKNYSGSYTLTETDGSTDVRVTTSSATVFIVSTTSTVSQGSETATWSLQGTITIDSDGKVLSVATVSQ